MELDPFPQSTSVPQTIFQRHFVRTINEVRKKLEDVRKGLRAYISSQPPGNGRRTAREELALTIRLLTVNIRKLPADPATIFEPVENALLDLPGCLSPGQAIAYINDPLKELVDDVSSCLDEIRLSEVVRSRNELLEQPRRLVSEAVSELLSLYNDMLESLQALLESLVTEEEEPTSPDIEKVPAFYEPSWPPGSGLHG